MTTIILSYPYPIIITYSDNKNLQKSIFKNKHVVIN